MLKKSTSLYRNTPQVGFLSIFFASMENPLNIWEKQIRGGYIRRLFDEDRVPALQLLAPNLLSTFITAPCSPYSTLGVRMNYLVLIVRKVARMFTFEVQIQDDTRLRRRFRFCNYQITVRRNISCCYAPLILQEGWNEVVVNLAEFTKKAYGTNYVECVRIKVYPNCRLRQVYFTATSISNQRVLNIMRTTFSNAPAPIPGSCFDLDESLFQKHSSQMSNIGSNHSIILRVRTALSKKVNSTATVNRSTKVSKVMSIENSAEADENEEGVDFGQIDEEIISAEEIENEESGRVTEHTGSEDDGEEMIVESDEVEHEEVEVFSEHTQTIVDKERILKVEEVKADEIGCHDGQIQADEAMVLELEIGGTEELSCQNTGSVDSSIAEMIVKESQENKNDEAIEVPEQIDTTDTQVDEEMVKESHGSKNVQADKIIEQTETLDQWSDESDLDVEFTPVNENE